METTLVDYTALLKKLQPNTKWRLFFGDGNVNNKFIHVRAIIDDMWVVWEARNVHSDHVYLFWLYDKEGYLTKAE